MLTPFIPFLLLLAVVLAYPTLSFIHWRKIKRLKQVIAAEKCPKCAQVFGPAILQTARENRGLGGPTGPLLYFSCPHCSTKWHYCAGSYTPAPDPSEYMKTRPTLDEFLALTPTLFSFLVSESGFTEEPLPGGKWENPFQVRFIGPTCRVIVEGRSFGAGVSVRFERLAGGHANLSEILAVRSPDLAKPLCRCGDQRVLLGLAATAVRQHALDAVRGEPQVYAAAQAHRQQLVNRMSR